VNSCSLTSACEQILCHLLPLKTRSIVRSLKTAAEFCIVRMIMDLETAQRQGGKLRWDGVLLCG
jgi:hypothetical protein